MTLRGSRDRSRAAQRPRGSPAEREPCPRRVLLSSHRWCALHLRPPAQRNLLRLYPVSFVRVVVPTMLVGRVAGRVKPASSFSFWLTADRYLKRHRDKRRRIVGCSCERLFDLLERHPALFCLDHGPDQADISDHGDARDLLARQHERDRRVHVLLLLERLVPRRPPLALQGTPLRPVPPRDGLYGHEPHILALYLLDERLKVPAIPFVHREDVVPGRHDRIEREAAQGLEVRRGSLVAVAGDPDGPDQALLTRLDGSLEGSAGGAVEIFQVVYAVELDQVNLVHPQALEGGPDLAPGGILLALAGLGGEEDLIPEPGHPAPVVQLGVAVVGGGVEVVHPGLAREPDGPIRRLLANLRERRPAEDEDRVHPAQASQLPILHARVPSRRVRGDLTPLSVPRAASAPRTAARRAGPRRPAPRPSLPALRAG